MYNTRAETKVTERNNELDLKVTLAVRDEQLLRANSKMAELNQILAEKEKCLHNARTERKATEMIESKLIMKEALAQLQRANSKIEELKAEKET